MFRAKLLSFAGARGSAIRPLGVVIARQSVCFLIHLLTGMYCRTPVSCLQGICTATCPVSSALLALCLSSSVDKAVQVVVGHALIGIDVAESPFDTGKQVVGRRYELVEARQ